jgi:selenide, water dikinase
VLGKLARQHDPNVLVGFDHADDAGVYQITPEAALVQTVDFFTPIVDDPYTFGQIAAANSLSDIYAMGARPLTALAMVCFPEKGDLQILERILAGGLSKMMEAGCTIIGGHSIRDDETKFGYSVTGMVNPAQVLKNGGAKAGDRLLLTKALGTGVISTAIKKGVAKQAWIEAAVESMTMLNKHAAEVITKHVGTGVHARPAERSSAVRALTDITGFGLIGHLREMLLASENVSAELHVSRVPLLDGAIECVHAGYIPGGLNANRDFAECVVDYKDKISDDMKTLLFDPQTSGGLLIAVAKDHNVEITEKLNAAGVTAIEIGEVLPNAKATISVVT